MPAGAYKRPMKRKKNLTLDGDIVQAIEALAAEFHNRNCSGVVNAALRDYIHELQERGRISLMAKIVEGMKPQPKITVKLYEKLLPKMPPPIELILQGERIKWRKAK